MKVLGLYDWHNCGASIVEDGKIIAAVEEERLSRNKIDFGMPYRSINEVLKISKTNFDEVDAVAVAGIRDPIFFARWKTSTFKFERKMSAYWNLQYTAWRIVYSLRNLGPIPTIERHLNRKIVSNKLKKAYGVDESKVYFVDHHLAHAASAYRTCGWGKALILGVDGSGDGYSTTVFKGEDGKLEFLAGASERASLGKLYSNITLGLGFKKISDEGKVMGLAASGDPDKFYDQIDDVIKIKDVDRLEFSHSEDLIGNSYAKKISRLYGTYSREDISAATQKKLENIMKDIVEHFVEKKNIAKVALTGGVAANVVMNQMIKEMEGVDDVFVFPNMTDGGLGSGAALEVCYALGNKEGKNFLPYSLEHVYLGPSYTNDEIDETIKANNLKAEFIDDIDGYVGELISKNKIVARSTGAMEYGPRALGNRSILSLATDPKVEDALNDRLNRNEFMPFAPSVLEEYAINEYFINGTKSPFMTMTFQVAKGIEEKFPAVVHVDGTCRPQTVDKKTNKNYGKILEVVGEYTGDCMILNTSYNMHGEPIVCSPQDAINTFRQNCVDYLALGNFLIKA